MGSITGRSWLATGWSTVRTSPYPSPKCRTPVYWGYSDVLGLYVCWEYSYLRWYDPVAGRYLPTYYEEADARAAAEAERDSVQAERAAAEAERDSAQARIRQLEAEIRRLQNP